MRWHLALEELSPELIYHKGSKNITEYTLSRLNKIDYLNKNNPNKNNKVDQL